MAIPLSTYRLQLRNGMTFAAAAELAGYWADLGVSHVYLSPIFAAVPGSPHGYDGLSYSEIEPEIGGSAGFDALAAALKARGVGLIVDFVPNHMGAHRKNPWWRDLLEWGRASRFADYFDIDWTAPRLVVPILGRPYGDELRGGRLGLLLDAGEGAIAMTYGDASLPLAPPSYATIFRGIERPPFPDLVRRLAVATPETSAEAKAAFAAVLGDPLARHEVEVAIARLSEDVEALHALLEAQVWRVAHWRTAREGLTYRRFFEIAELVGLRVERQAVFEETHRVLARLVRNGSVDGIRIDHIDGLSDPRAYLTSLQAILSSPNGSVSVFVEKILGPGEALPANWPVTGTTGYEFLTALSGLFVDGEGEASLSAAYVAFVGRSVDFDDLVRATKRFILTRNLAGELEHLRDLARRVADADRATRDFGPDSLRRALLEVAAAMPVYRTYVAVEGPDSTDLKVIDAAVTAAKATREVEDEAVLDFIGRLLRMDFAAPELQAAALAFTIRFQQTTGPVMAKAVEDTAFYRWNRLAALNEVGGSPTHFGAPTEAFHAAMAARAIAQPHGFSATATHDTKRGEDARARIYAISEAPDLWADAVASWHEQLGTGVDAEIEWLFYQALLGAWPADPPLADGELLMQLRGRMEAYLLKAVRESKVHTSWTSPDVAYEAAVRGLVSAAFDNAQFLADFSGRCQPFILAGAVTSLAQLAIKLTAPGIPDIYQGTEFWDLSLVDPDNRRPVDLAARRAHLAAIKDAQPADLATDWRSGRPKLALLAAGLGLRNSFRDLFNEGTYRSLEVSHAAGGHAVAFAREREQKAVVVIAPRHPFRLLRGGAQLVIPASAWGKAAIDLPSVQGAFRDVMTGKSWPGGQPLRLAEALASLPVAILQST